MSLLDILFVRKCKVCNQILSRGAVCGACNKGLVDALDVKACSINVADKVILGKSLFEYENPLVKKLVFALKRTADRELFEYMANFYMMILPRDFSGIITNVPRRKSNVREYGYDHVAKLCKVIAGKSEGKIRYVPIIKRVGFSKEQKNLNTEQRVKNAMGKFKLKKKNITSDILLVDDVVTTGNTVKSCAKLIPENNPDANVQLMFFASRR